MNNQFYILGIVLAAFGLAACNSNPLEDFVERSISIDINTKGQTATLSGSGHLEFSHTTYFTNYRRVCETELCGYDDVYRCHQRERCFNDGSIPGEPPCDPHKDRRCRPNHRRCEVYQDCGIEQVARFCEVNCRDVPYLDSSTSTQQSVLNVVVKRTDQGQIDAKAIKSLFLGVKTNSRFEEAFSNLSLRPKGLEFLFDGLDKKDKTLVILKAKGYQLVQRQEFLKLPENFSAGDSTTLEIVIEPTSNDKAAFSAVGSEVDFPSLHTSSSRD